MKSSFNMSPDFGSGLGKLVVKTKQEPVEKKVDPFEIGQHKPAGVAKPQVFSCKEKWPEKAGWYLATWGSPDRRPEADGILIVRYMDPLNGCSDPIYSYQYYHTSKFRDEKYHVTKGKSHQVATCNGNAAECMYWTDAPLPKEVLETLKQVS